MVGSGIRKKTYSGSRRQKGTGSRIRNTEKYEKQEKKENEKEEKTKDKGVS
jgi:hypothetical protein